MVPTVARRQAVCSRSNIVRTKQFVGQVTRMIMVRRIALIQRTAIIGLSDYNLWAKSGKSVPLGPDDDNELEKGGSSGGGHASVGSLGQKHTEAFPKCLSLC